MNLSTRLTVAMVALVLLTAGAIESDQPERRSGVCLGGRAGARMVRTALTTGAELSTNEAVAATPSRGRTS
jgi:predicted component of type VI protein secretion system